VSKVGRILVFHGGKVDVQDAVSGRRLRTVTIGAVYQYLPAVVLERTAPLHTILPVKGNRALPSRAPFGGALTCH